MSLAADGWRCLLVACALAAMASAGRGVAAADPVLKGPIKVSARHAEFDERGKRMLYRGNVKLVSAELELSGDRLELTQSGKGLYEARITGTPARLVHAGTKESLPMSARANLIIYDTRASTVALTGAAVLTRGDDELTSERIRYNAATRRVQASGVNGEQVRLVIQPPDESGKKK